MSIKKEVLIDILYKELEHVRKKNQMTDEWFFKIISIGVIPFLLFIAYALINESFKIILCALPFLSVLGLFVISIIVNHYLYCRYYGAYLQARINSLLEKDEILDFVYGEIFYTNKKSMVSISFAFSFVLLILINIIAFPLIENVLNSYLNSAANIPGIIEVFITHFWVIVFLFFIIVLGGSGFIHIKAVKTARSKTIELLKKFTTSEKIERGRKQKKIPQDHKISDSD
jgi:hypothetical protein